MPPSTQPEMSPMVSTAVTRNMIRMERMAWRLKAGFTGRSWGTENHLASAILDQLTYQEAVKALPSASTSSWGMTTPMMEAAIYPTMIPQRIQEVDVIPFVKCFSTTMTVSTRRPSSRLGTEPKSLAPLPPAKELTPTLIRLSPMASTTLPVTTGGKNFRRGLIKKPRAASHTPPTMAAPTMAL